MLRCFLLLCFVFLPSLALADSPWIGQMVFIKYNAQGKVGNKVVDPGGSPTTVTQVNGNWLWLGKAWVTMKDVMTVDQALVYYTNEIKTNPDKTIWFLRGRAWHEKDEYDNAIKDFTEAIRLDPSYSFAYNHRGIAWSSKHDIDRANRDYNEAIRHDPTNAPAYCNRGRLSHNRGEYDNALKDYTEAIRLDPKASLAYNERAWLQATCPDARYRNGEQAIKDAIKACEISKWNHWVEVSTLGEAYAEAGDFKNAIKWQKKAIELDTKNEMPGKFERVKLYESGQPYREPVVKK